MNANELIKKLEDTYEGSGYLEVLADDAATMLRQQADLIRNLQKSLGFKNSGYETINLTPQLELTDEEIRGVADEVFSTYKNWHHYQIDFARAILRKAQEK